MLPSAGAKHGQDMTAVIDSHLGQRKRIRVLVLFTSFAVAAALFFGLTSRAKRQHELNTKLIGAVRNSDTEAARKLLAQGADPNARDVPERKLTVWEQIERAFLKNPDGSSSRYTTALELALYPNSETDAETASELVGEQGGENASLVKALLDAGARVEENSSPGHETPLMTAVDFDQSKTVQTMLDHRANAKAKDDAGQIPLHHLRENLLIAELLLKAGNDVNARDNQGMTPLMAISCKCVNGTPEMIRFLIAHGAKVDARSKDGTSSLLNTVYSNDIHSLQLLIEQGADVNLGNTAGDTPLSVAKQKNDDEAINLLEAAGAKH